MENQSSLKEKEAVQSQTRLPVETVPNVKQPRYKMELEVLFFPLRL